MAGLALSYVAHVLLSRLLGLHGYGQYVIALGWTLVLVIPARFGFDNSSLRYVTVYIDERKYGALHGFVRTAIGTVIFISTYTRHMLVMLLSRSGSVCFNLIPC